MTKKLIIFNGPPGSGKDTAAKHVVRYCTNQLEMVHVTHRKMATPLKEAVHKLFNLSKSPDYYDNFREEKEKPIASMFDMSPRQAYIGLSEKAIKPWLGDDVFGRIAANIIHNDDWSKLHVYSDGGFADEWSPVIDYLGPDAVRVVELSSASCDWSGDSRSYIGEQLKLRYPTIKVTKLNNTISKDPFDKQFFLLMVEGIVQQVLGMKPC